MKANPSLPAPCPADTDHDATPAGEAASPANATVWRILKARSEQEIVQQLAQWFARWAAHPDQAAQAAELAPYAVDQHIARREWDAIRTRLERRFGRYHPRHKPLIDVLLAAGQARRLLQARSLQQQMDELRSQEAWGRTL